MEENILIDKLKLKDELAFREFVDLNKSMVISICYKFLRNKNDAEDVSQEVFIEIFKSIKNFNYSSKLNTWIYRIAVNKCLDFQKMMKRKKRLGVILSIFGLENSEKNLQHNINPYQLMVQNENQQRILNAIDKLPDNQKVALTLAKLEGLSYQEISIILGNSVTAVDSLIQRAKKNLKKFLEADGF